MKKIVLCVVLMTTSLAAEKVPPPKTVGSVAEARKVADQTMNLMRQEKFEEGYATVKPYWPLPVSEIEDLAAEMKKQWPMVEERYGKPLATEFISEKKVGDSFVQFVYLQKFDRHAIRWTFVFYKATDRWMVNGVRWDDGVYELF